MATQQPILFFSTNASHASTTEYLQINARDNNWNATLASNELLVPTGGKFVELNIKIGTAPGSGNSRTFNLMVDGVASSLTLTFSNTDTEKTVTVDVAITGGELVTLESVATSTPDQFDRIDGNVLWQPTIDEEYIYMGGHPASDTDTSATEYSPLNGGTLSWGGTRTKRAQPCPIGGTVKKLAVYAAATPGTGGETYTFKVMRDATASTETVVIADGDETTTQFNNSDILTVTAGEALAFQCVPTGGPTPIKCLCSCVFAPETTGKIPLLGGSGNFSMSSTETRYGSVGEVATFDGARSLRAIELINIEMVFEAGYVKLNSNAGGSGFDINFEVDAVDQAGLQIVIGSGESAQSTTGASVTVSAGESFNIESVPNSSPAARTMQHGYLYTFGAAAPAPVFVRNTMFY